MSDETSPAAPAAPMAPPVAPSLPAQIYRSAAIIGRKPLYFTYAPDLAAQASLAAQMGLLGLRSFVLKGVFLPKGRSDVTLQAQMRAQITQSCIITFAPVISDISSTISRDYLRDFIEPGASEAELGPEDHEAIPEEFDVAAIAIEELLLSLPLYPRAAGAELGARIAAPHGAQPLDDAALRPFAALATLAQSMAAIPATDPAADPNAARAVPANQEVAQNKGKTPK